MFQRQFDEAGIFCRAGRSIDRSVSFREGDYLGEIVYEGQELAESPDTATIEIVIDGASFAENGFGLRGTASDVE